MGEEERRAADASIDLEADTNSCPACLGQIPRGQGRCPDCGLRLF